MVNRYFSATAPLVLLVSFGLGGTGQAQTAPLVMALGAPNCTGATTMTGCTPDPTHFSNFETYLIPHVSGIVLMIPWNSVDNCSVSAPCSGQAASCAAEGLPGNNNYKWCAVDNGLMQYIRDTANFTTSKKIALIIDPVSDGSPNLDTPAYVFTSTWSNSLSSNAQDQVVCGGWPGNVPSCPVRFTSTGTGAFEPGDFALWDNVGTNTPHCTNSPYGTASLNIECYSCTTPDIGGFPIPYEIPFQTAYQQFLKAIADHYNTTTGQNMGPSIAPYIAYVRPGMAEGGENQAYCATTSTINSGRVQQSSWAAAPTNVPAGYVINTAGSQYVAMSAGAKGTTLPTCSPDGCTTPPDGGISGWYRAGPWTNPPFGNGAVWPGIDGQFNTFGGNPVEHQAYADNGYLSFWDNGDGTGYIASMANYLQSLHAQFPFTISAHSGPPANSNIAYADSDAAIASSNWIGFGMQSVNVYDSYDYAAGIFPTSESDWAHNFLNYPAPVHHLQTFFPGSPPHAAGFPIQNIGPPTGMSSGTPTIFCYTDCSLFSSTAGGYPLYITGNSNPQFNGIVMVAACPLMTGCTANQLTLANFGSISTSYSGGTVWAPDFLPIILPFAVRHDATTLEIYECDLDYAFGLYTAGHTTTNWNTSSGCLIPSGSPPSPVTDSVDAGYKGSIADTLTGQPAVTSIRTGQSLLVQGLQY